MTRPRWIFVAIALALALAVTWYFASPWYTLSQMRSAARSGDSDGLAAYVDFPALRENMKAEMSARLLADSNADRSGWGRLGTALESAMIGPMVDGIVSPAGIRAAFIAQREGSALADGNAAPAALKLPKDPVLVRRGFDSFLVASRKHPDSGLVFTRHGLGWQLSGVDIPPEQ